MMNEYELVFKRLKNVHINSDGETYERETTETPEQFAKIINSIIHFDGIVIEIIGSWVWVSGNTYDYKEQLKELHFFYSKSKKAWYYTGEERKCCRKGHYSMKELRNRYGVINVDTEEQEKIAG